MAKKWIVSGDTFIIGNPAYHFELARKGEPTIGGGYWHKDPETDTLYLYDKSQEFGRCTLEEVSKPILNGLLPPSIASLRIVFSTEDDLEEAMKNYSVIKEKGEIP